MCPTHSADFPTLRPFRPRAVEHSGSILSLSLPRDDPMKLEPGDIACCYGTDLASRAISCGTASLIHKPKWGPSHVAIIVADPEDASRRLLWCESTTLSHIPCQIAGQRVSGVQFHEPMTRVDEYLRGHGGVDLYRLNPFHRLDAAEVDLLGQLLREVAGIGYDMGGAILSGTRIFQLSKFFPGANSESLFCSELVAAVLMRLNRMNHTNPARYNPGRLVRELVRTGKYSRVLQWR